MTYIRERQRGGGKKKTLKCLMQQLKLAQIKHNPLSPTKLQSVHHCKIIVNTISTVSPCFLCCLNPDQNVRQTVTIMLQSQIELFNTS